jgi:hypothetical protein
LGGSAAAGRSTGVTRHPARVAEGTPQQELDLGVGAAQFVCRPLGDRVVYRRVESEQDLLAFAHGDRLRVQRAGVDHRRCRLLAAQDHEQVYESAAGG